MNRARLVQTAHHKGFSFLVSGLGFSVQGLYGELLRRRGWGCIGTSETSLIALIDVRRQKNCTIELRTNGVRG